MLRSATNFLALNWSQLFHYIAYQEDDRRFSKERIEHTPSICFSHLSMFQAQDADACPATSKQR